MFKVFQCNILCVSILHNTHYADRNAAETFDRSTCTWSRREDRMPLQVFEDGNDSKKHRCIIAPHLLPSQHLWQFCLDGSQRGSLTRETVDLLRFGDVLKVPCCELHVGWVVWEKLSSIIMSSFSHWWANCIYHDHFATFPIFSPLMHSHSHIPMASFPWLPLFGLLKPEERLRYAVSKSKS